jgi:hypothetical protein
MMINIDQWRSETIRDDDPGWWVLTPDRAYGQWIALSGECAESAEC